MKFSTIALIAIALYVLAKDKISEYLNFVTIGFRGLKFKYYKLQLYLLPDLTLSSAAPVNITVKSALTIIKYNGQEIARSTDTNGLTLTARSTVTYQPEILVKGISTATAIINLIKGGDLKNFSYSGTLYTSTGAIPWSYTDTTTATTNGVRTTARISPIL